mmetsp:Transcript_14713/g.57724  ORF Transcript_14713/g.57724 Transcript_14713/m.57724 type:complete len:387 (+) Transcript_14713:621-1781(+)
MSRSAVPSKVMSNLARSSSTSWGNGARSARTAPKSMPERQSARSSSGTAAKGLSWPPAASAMAVSPSPLEQMFVSSSSAEICARRMPFTTAASPEMTLSAASPSAHEPLSLSSTSAYTARVRSRSPPAASFAASFNTSAAGPSTSFSAVVSLSLCRMLYSTTAARTAVWQVLASGGALARPRRVPKAPGAFQTCSTAGAYSSVAAAKSSSAATTRPTLGLVRTGMMSARRPSCTRAATARTSWMQACQRQETACSRRLVASSKRAACWVGARAGQPAATYCTAARTMRMSSGMLPASASSAAATSSPPPISRLRRAPHAAAKICSCTSLVAARSPAPATTASSFSTPASRSTPLQAAALKPHAERRTQARRRSFSSLDWSLSTTVG